MTRRFVAFSRFLVLAVAAAGCGASDNLPRERITGRVTLDGQPLESGTIQFMPAAPSAGGEAIGGGAIVVAGGYEIPRDKGLIPGSYRVNIFSPDTAAAPAEDDNGPPSESKATPKGRSRAKAKEDRPAKERIPARYNSASTLTADVTAGGKNAFDYELTSK